MVVPIYEAVVPFFFSSQILPDDSTTHNKSVSEPSSSQKVKIKDPNFSKLNGPRLRASVVIMELCTFVLAVHSKS
jgi:hypothetical protein